jgi:hypothetical protein
LRSPIHSATVASELYWLVGALFNELGFFLDRPRRKNCEPIVLKMWETRLLIPLWAFTACYRDSFTFNSNNTARVSYDEII